MLYENSFCRRAALAMGLCLSLLAISDAQADTVTYRVGPSWGQPASNCQYPSPAAAIKALPDPAPGVIHHIMLEATTYTGVSAALLIRGHQVIVSSSFNRGSKCNGDPPPSGIGAELRVDNSALEGGRTIVVQEGGKLTLDGVRVTGNTRGAILVRDSNLTLRSAVISENSTPAGVSGAGIVNEGGRVLVDESSFIEDNAAGSNGGAVFCAGLRTMAGDQSAFVTFAGDGGGTSFIRRNSARRGGGIYQLSDCTVSLDGRTTLTGNSATLSGGAVASDPATSGTFGNRLLLRGDYVAFIGNTAGEDGAAISLAGPKAKIQASTSAKVSFNNNLAQRYGGAIDLAGAGAEGTLVSARFLDNRAEQGGGAISVRAGSLSLAADCASGNTVNDDYCALFDGNRIGTGTSQARRGGALYVEGGSLSIDGFAFRDAFGPSSDDSNVNGGAVAFVTSGGFLGVTNSIVFDNPSMNIDQQYLFQLIAGGSARFSFNTIVGVGRGSAFLSRSGTTASFIGNIITGHSRGVDSGGQLLASCNNMQIGANPAPLDPGFVTTPAGRYRLGAGSPMIDGGLDCSSAILDSDLPSKDLDGNARVETGETARQIDLGALEFRIDSDVLFADGFESVP